MIKLVRDSSLLLLSLALLNLIGSPGLPAAAHEPRLGKISPWVLTATQDGGQTDFLLVLSEQADLSPAYELPTQLARGRFVHRRLVETAQRSQAPLRAWLDAQGVAYRPFYIVNLIHVRSGDRALVETLSARPDVARIEANPSIRLSLPPTQSPIYQSPTQIEWNVAWINADDVWALGYTGQGVLVGGQDTGYDWDHPALIDAYRGWDGATATHDYNWYDAVAGSPEPIDPYGHGTHTMGTLVGDDGGENQIGVAPGARWIGCRNMDDNGYGSPATYLACFEFFLAPFPLDGNPSQGQPDLAPDVTNNSWVCPTSEGCSWDTLQAAVEAQRAAGIMTVVSVGNQGPACSSAQYPPGLYDAAYSVGASTSSDGIASFSSRGPVTRDGSGRLKPDISAPGVSVRSCLPGGGYGLKSGTSMAAPHVAGAVALLWSARPDLRDHLGLTEFVLNTTALPRYSIQCGDASDAVPNNVYGWGRLDALAAVQQALAWGGLGRLQGRVSDEQGAPVVAAEIQASLNPTQGLASLSGVDGWYGLPLFAGTYTVTAAAPGFSPYRIAGLLVPADVTTTLNITLCRPVQGASFGYAPVGPQVGQTITFTGAVTAGTPPIGYAWDFGDGTVVGGPNGAATLTHTYALSGVYTVVMSATNCLPEFPYGDGGPAQVTTTRLITVTAPGTCVSLEGVELSLAVPGTVRLGDEALFSADLAPDDAAKPYRYTVHVVGQSAGIPQTGHQDPLVFGYTFATPGVHTVEFGAWNCAMTVPVSDALEVVVLEPPYDYETYLPLVVRQGQ